MEIWEEPFCGNLEEKCRTPIPRHTFCASLRSWNAHGHFTRAILCGNLHAPATASIKHRALTLAVGTPSVWLRCLGKFWLGNSKKKTGGALLVANQNAPSSFQKLWPREGIPIPPKLTSKTSKVNKSLESSHQHLVLGGPFFTFFVSLKLGYTMIIHDIPPPYPHFVVL